MWPPYCCQTKAYFITPDFKFFYCSPSPSKGGPAFSIIYTVPYNQASAFLSDSSFIKLLIAQRTLIIINYLYFYPISMCSTAEMSFPQTSPHSHLTLVCLAYSYSSFKSHSLPLSGLFWPSPLYLTAPFFSHDQITSLQLFVYISVSSLPN